MLTRIGVLGRCVFHFGTLSWVISCDLLWNRLRRMLWWLGVLRRIWHKQWKISPRWLYQEVCRSIVVSVILWVARPSPGFNVYCISFHSLSKMERPWQPSHMQNFVLKWSEPDKVCWVHEGKACMLLNCKLLLWMVDLEISTSSRVFSQSNGKSPHLAVGDNPNSCWRRRPVEHASLLWRRSG